MVSQMDHESALLKNLKWYTLDSGINVALGISVASGTFGKTIKRSP